MTGTSPKSAHTGSPSTANREWTIRQLLVQHCCEQLDTHFTLLGVRYMPVKGAFLICSGLASHLQSRTMLDIDLLIEHEHDLPRVTDYFFSLENVRPLHCYSRSFQSPFLYRWGHYRYPVEIHSRLDYDERYRLPTHELFQRGQNRTAMQVMPSAEDALCIAACHALTHIGYEFRETLLQEMAVLAGQESFSWNTFFPIAHSTGIDRFITFLLLMLERKKATRIPLPKRYLLSRCAAYLFRLLPYSRTPLPIRRLLFEFFFLRKPIPLALRKIQSQGLRVFEPGSMGKR